MRVLNEADVGCAGRSGTIGFDILRGCWYIRIFEIRCLAVTVLLLESRRKKVVYINST